MVQRLEEALSRLYQKTSLPPYGTITPIPMSLQGVMGPARTIWTNAGKPGGEGNALFQRAVLEYMNIVEVDLLIEDENAIVNDVATWEWKELDEFGRQEYLIARDILYDCNYLGPPGGAEIDPDV